ncbi:phosphatase PAP2 family protein [Streptomyces sp. AC563]|uniref:bifunctional phosphatase PAP2/diacylglycerol kinase family protein n=2 Tax=Streptomyces TaxID=1883 RepID=UPI00164D0E88|nr:bifunctional phosphatase PAP2/diacylglycerol kinase family protein [Streptomyces buecherae]MBC3991613.1 phosphatase PAP2 family protein [Streptomyces buecherae]
MAGQGGVRGTARRSRGGDRASGLAAAWASPRRAGGRASWPARLRPAGPLALSAVVGAPDALLSRAAAAAEGWRGARRAPWRRARATRAARAAFDAAATDVTPTPGHPGVGDHWLVRLDKKLFHTVASRHWPGAERVLPRLSHSANHGRLWLALAAGMAATGHRTTRRAAVRGVASLALASLTVNTVAKRSVRRTRPLVHVVPMVRRLRRQPITTSFPSGHSASAAAFAVGVALESPRWGAVVAPIAASVAFSRIYTGAHYPSDVLVGSALGAGAALAVRGLVPTRSQLPPAARPRTDAPALPRGRGLIVVANSGSGATSVWPPRADPLDPIREALPEAEFWTFTPDPEPDLVPEEERARTAAERSVGGAAASRTAPDAEPPSLLELLEKAARRAAEVGGALGVCGGDGTVSAAAAVAAREGLPLAVLPGGTLNHFAYDLGLETVDDTCRAVTAGQAVAVDLARFTADGAATSTATHYVNTFSIGCYPEMVRIRERWAGRVGSWAAEVLAAAQVLRTAEPLDLVINGKRRAVWMLFVGNCSYRGVGSAPASRHDLADGLLDVRMVHGGRLPRARLLSAALLGVLRRSPVHAEARLRHLRVDEIPEGADLAYDGEITRAPRGLTLDKVNEALRVYRPLEV